MGIHKELFPVYGGKCLSRKTVRNWTEKFSKNVRKSQMVPAQVALLRLRQKQDFCAVGFDALVKQWNKCINVGRGYVEKCKFSQVGISHVLRFISICDLFTDPPS
jgi:stage V sporulation protein SpoVS